MPKKMSLFPRGQNFIESLFFPDTKKMSLFPRGQSSYEKCFVKGLSQKLEIELTPQLNSVSLIMFKGLMT